jgi:adenylate kinase
MLMAFWFLLKEVVEGYVFSVEAAAGMEPVKVSGEEKKKAVVEDTVRFIDSAQAVWPQLPAWLFTIIKLLVPLLVDAAVSRLNIEQKLLPHQQAPL